MWFQIKVGTLCRDVPITIGESEVKREENIDKGLITIYANKFAICAHFTVDPPPPYEAVMKE